MKHVGVPEGIAEVKVLKRKSGITELPTVVTYGRVIESYIEDNIIDSNLTRKR